MSSTFTWLDYSETERNRMKQFIDQFRETESRDELGIGSIRDGFSDLLFPGMSTVYTRAHYLLFVPWIYRQLEQQRVPSEKIAQVARRKEIQLIEALLKSDTTDGVIGKRARSKIKRLPSNIYWRGLRTFGIRLFHGNQETYHQSLNWLYAASKERTQRASESDALEDTSVHSWHPYLPSPPDTFPEQASFSFEPHEADYLRDRIQTRVPHSLLAWLVALDHLPPVVHFPWQHPYFGDFPTHIQEQLEHGQNFSEIIRGAAFLYNLMLAEKSNADELADEYRERIDEWADAIDDRHTVFANWNLNRMWEILSGARLTFATRTFATTWITLVRGMDNPAEIADDERSRTLIHQRERTIKGKKARLDNQRALELWQGASGIAPLDYRWSPAQRIMFDILEGIPEEAHHAASI